MWFRNQVIMSETILKKNSGAHNLKNNEKKKGKLKIFK